LTNGDGVGGGGGGRRAIEDAQHAAAANGDATRGVCHHATASLILGLGGESGQGAEAKGGEEDARAQGAVPHAASVHAQPAMRHPQGGHDPAAKRAGNASGVRQPMAGEPLAPAGLQPKARWRLMAWIS
jgi:hypothetical protein